MSFARGIHQRAALSRRELSLSRTPTRGARGVGQAVILDTGLLASAGARRLDEHAHSLREDFAPPATFARRGDQTAVSGPSDLLEAVNAGGCKGVTFQRYKGLGEMNKDQLWETTLDREARSLLQVKIREVDEVDDIFVKLMGDVVEPRREFIQDNAERVEFGRLIPRPRSGRGLPSAPSPLLHSNPSWLISR